MLHPAPTTGKTDWFVNDRFGMFIHWGIYALGARHEWLKNYESMTDEAYQRYFDHFNPDLFDPKAWARTAREAGMKYFVITTKHHDGFCLWDSKHTDWKVTNTGFKREVLREVVNAFRAEGLRIGFYYSLIDWHHPEFPLDPVHPQRARPDAKELNKGRDMRIYAQYLRDQVTELLTQFGNIDILWFDFSYPNSEFEGLPGKGHNEWESEELIRLVRKLAPDIIVNDRLDLPRSYSDIYTPEQFQPVEWCRVDGEPMVWEACHTFSGSWGYHRDETTWKSAEQLVGILIDSVSKGGNLLMNVGPNARGEFDPRAQEALGAYADWMKLHGRSIYGCTQSEFTPPANVTYTQNGNKLYAHVLEWPFKTLRLPKLADKVAYAQLLNDGSEILFEHSPPGAHGNLNNPTPADTLSLQLPVARPKVVVPVIELFLK